MTLKNRFKTRIIIVLILVLGVMGIANGGRLAAQTDPSDYTTGDYSSPPLSVTSTDAPTIQVWHGQTQTFGTRGGKRSVPQTWVNILGNVSSAGSIISLNYTLNGGPAIPLQRGPDGERLAKSGDFNVQIDYKELIPGNNALLISAVDSLGGVNQQPVTVVYSTSGTTWAPGTYTWDWSTAEKVTDLAQPVDGQWKLDNGGVRSTDIGFDRLLTIGDMSWRDYTITVPITIYGIDLTGDGPGIGILTRWNGHFAVSGEQPPYTGWFNMGALAWYRWKNDWRYDKEGLQIIGTQNIPIGTWPETPKLAFGVTYYFKVQVESPANQSNAATYRFKVWPSTEAEPVAWNIEGTGFSFAPAGGSILLVAHYVDAHFGDVTVELASTQPSPMLTVYTTGTGSGSVQRDPVGPTVQYGEVVLLTPQPAVGSVFAGWSGDLAGMANPASIAMYGDKTVTAIFNEAENCSLDIITQGSGSVTADPDLETYECGTNVTLKASPELGHIFSGWSGSVTGTSNPINVIVGQNTQVTATFTAAPERKLTITTNGNGEVNINPSKSGYLHGESVTLTAVPGDGANFTGWGGDATGSTNPLTIVMDGDKAISANFEAKTYRLTVYILDGGGSVTTNPQGMEFSHGTKIQLRAYPSEGFYFAGWSGDLVSKSNPVWVTITDDMIINAAFQPGTATYSLFLPAVLDVAVP